VWLVITFTALFLVMWRLAVPRIADVLEARQKRIADNLAKAEASKKEAESALAAYEQALAEARAEAHALVSEAAQKVAAEAAEREARQAEQLQRRIVDAETAIGRAVDAAVANVRTAVLEVAASAVERLTDEAPAKADIAQAVDRALKVKG
ncbi:MAG: F0F1 ATP synthase subunit B', partial [Rhodospirillales bacterium]